MMTMMTMMTMATASMIMITTMAVLASARTGALNTVPTQSLDPSVGCYHTLCGKVMQDVSNVQRSIITGDQRRKSINDRLARLEVSHGWVPSVLSDRCFWCTISTISIGTISININYILKYKESVYININIQTFLTFRCRVVYLDC